jgi:excisionase family DNA binding protein
VKTLVASDRMTLSGPQGKGSAEPLRPLAVSFEEAERLVGLSRFTLRRYAHQGKLGATKCGRRWIVPVVELDRLVREGVSRERRDGR